LIVNKFCFFGRLGEFSTIFWKERIFDNFLKRENFRPFFEKRELSTIFWKRENYRPFFEKREFSTIFWKERIFDHFLKRENFRPFFGNESIFSNFLKRENFPQFFEKREFSTIFWKERIVEHTENLGNRDKREIEQFSKKTQTHFSSENNNALPRNNFLNISRDLELESYKKKKRKTKYISATWKYNKIIRKVLIEA
jgi:hypothetical protein